MLRALFESLFDVVDRPKWNPGVVYIRRTQRVAKEKNLRPTQLTEFAQPVIPWSFLQHIRDDADQLGPVGHPHFVDGESRIVAEPWLLQYLLCEQLEL